MLGVFDACRIANGDGPIPFGQACVIPGVWAMIGATSFLAGVTRTTVSLAVIMLYVVSLRFSKRLSLIFRFTSELTGSVVCVFVSHRYSVRLTRDADILYRS